MTPDSKQANAMKLQYCSQDARGGRGAVGRAVGHKGIARGGGGRFWGGGFLKLQNGERRIKIEVWQAARTEILTENECDDDLFREQNSALLSCFEEFTKFYKMTEVPPINPQFINSPHHSSIQLQHRMENKSHLFLWIPPFSDLPQQLCRGNC